jgi:cellulose synthase/poly-beta-1,6-N-acetylglucosamine synthase-like glycosyltransferase
VNSFWAHLFLGVQWAFFIYFLCINAAYLALHYVSVFSIVRYMRDHRAEYLPRNLPAYQPPLSILIPALNEERSINSTIHSLLQLDYPEFEVVIVNDGSTDSTLSSIIREFSMVEFPEAYRQRIPTAPIRAIYASTRYPNVRLVDKDNGGKADALNAGINCIRYPLYCAIDADCILHPGSLSRIVRPFLEDSNTVACGGVVRVLNGCTVKNGFLERVELPRKFLPMFQNVEYLRAFLFGRVGWSPSNALLVISGAFGAFYKERVVAVGGYRSDTVGEDMDLVVRLHRQLREQRDHYRISFVPDPICWTEVPSDLKSLRGQRVRWQRGLAESLIPNLGLCFNRRGGAVGWLAFPFMFLFELLGPIIEVLGYVATIVLWFFHLIPLLSFLVFIFLALGMGIMLSTNAIFLEELSFQMYPRMGQQLKLFAAAVLENFGYRQLTAWWRVIGVFRWMFSGKARSHWGVIARDGSWQHPVTAHEPATGRRGAP